MRLFAAISPPDEARDRLEGLQSGLPAERRVPWENFHITLAFFGDVDGAQAKDLDAALGALRFAPFEAKLAGVDVFGGDRPRLIYAGVEASTPLTALQSSVVNAARAAGIALEAKRYVPHVTLARLWGKRADERLLNWLTGAAAFAAPPFAVESFNLYSSTLGSGAPVYQALKTYPARS